MISNEPTGLMVKVIRATSRGSDYRGLARFAQKICQKHTQHVTEGKERELMVKSISINPEVAHMAIENVYCNLLMLNLIY